MLCALQGRGASQGYDNAVALPAASDSEELAKENSKSVAASKGEQGMMGHAIEAPYTYL